jgi:D-alanine transaminase
MPEVVYLNGQRVPHERACISIDDRGFLYGDAVYDVVRAYHGRLWAADRHFRRLARSLAESGIEGVDLDALRELATRAVAESGFADANVYLHVTRGAEPRRLGPGPDLRPNVLLLVRDSAGISSPACFQGVSAITVPDLRWRRCDIKSTSMLGNVMARMEAKRAGVYEAIMYDEEDCITEAAAMSVLAVERGTVFTTPLGPAILSSINRELLIEMAGDLGIPVREERLARERFRKMEEIFLTSTTHEVCPVLQLDGQPVGDSKAGPITARLLETFLARIAAGDDAPRTRP